MPTLPRRSLADVMGQPQMTEEDLAAMDAAAPTGIGAGLEDTSVLSDADLAQLAGTGADTSAVDQVPQLQAALGGELDPMQRQDIQQRLELAARRRLAGV